MPGASVRASIFVELPDGLPEQDHFAVGVELPEQRLLALRRVALGGMDDPKPRMFLTFRLSGRRADNLATNRRAS